MKFKKFEISIITKFQNKVKYINSFEFRSQILKVN